MLPGMGGRVNPRDMRRMMKQLGIDMREIPDVEEVVVRTKTKEFVIREAEVSIMKAQGQETWQINGEVTERPRGAPAPADAPAAAPAPLFTDADVDLVASQANVSKERARKALEDAKGEPAEAILKLVEGGA